MTQEGRERKDMQIIIPDNLREYIIKVEQDFATQQLNAMAHKVKESDFMYVAGEYNACKNICKFLKITYNFLY